MKNQQIIFQNKPPPAMKAHRQTKKHTPAPCLFRKLCEHAHKASGTHSQSFGNTPVKPIQTTLYETDH